MKPQINTLFIILASLGLLAACSKTECLQADQENSDKDFAIVSIEEALCRLEDFMADVKMKSIDATNSIPYASITPYYSDKSLTKSGEKVPEAYLVNFENDGGYAILGANTNITPIIAVVEEGNTNWEEIMSVKDTNVPEYSEDPLECALLGPGLSTDRLISACVKGALYGYGQNNDLLTRTTYTTEVLPLLGYDYSYEQHHTYCHKNNNKYVLCGCASVAISMVLSYMKPSRFIIDGQLINFNALNTKDGRGIQYDFLDGNTIFVKPEDYFINSSSIPTTLTNTQMLSLLDKIDPSVINSHDIPSITSDVDFYRSRYKVTSAVFYTLSNIIKTWDATGTMPNALVEGLETIKFSNVQKLKEDHLTAGQINMIINMLTDNKPVLMCGWSLASLSESHYWVVDGIKKNNTETLIHCNWGWGGVENGWFAADCIRPYATEADNGNQWNNILVFSYDKPSATNPFRNTTFMDEHRVMY